MSEREDGGAALSKSTEPSKAKLFVSLLEEGADYIKFYTRKKPSAKFYRLIAGLYPYNAHCLGIVHYEGADVWLSLFVSREMEDLLDKARAAGIVSVDSLRCRNEGRKEL